MVHHEMNSSAIPMYFRFRKEESNYLVEVATPLEGVATPQEGVVTPLQHIARVSLSINC